MLEPLSLFAVGFMAALSGVLMPGPVFVFILHQSMLKGFKAGVLAASAHAVVAVMIVILAVVGLAPLFESQAFQLYIGAIGGFSLIVLGSIIIKSSRKSSEFGERNSTISVGPFTGGLIVSLANPAFFLWWAVIGLPMLGYVMDRGGVLGVLSWMVGSLAAIFAWYGGIAYASARGRKHVEKLLFPIALACGLFLIFMGILMIIKYLVLS